MKNFRLIFYLREGELDEGASITNIQLFFPSAVCVFRFPWKWASGCAFAHFILFVNLVHLTTKKSDEDETMSTFLYKVDSIENRVQLFTNGRVKSTATRYNVERE